MEKGRILIIDDDENLREGLVDLLQSREFYTKGAPDAESAMQILEEDVFELIITDYKMQQMDGLDLLKKIHKKYPSLKAIMMTGYGSVEHAVEAMQSGAVNYIQKPVKAQKLIEIINGALSDTTTLPTGAEKSQVMAKMRHFQDMVGISKPMQQIYRKINEVAHTDVPVLILGESGTGKELVARAVHNLSPRSSNSFVAVNTGAIPRELIASELFGHLKGAFTGAISDKKGKFEEAHQGTLFLDEIGTMSLPVQISLLRVLETHVVERVGGSKPIPVDVRIICASNEDLQNLIQQHKFREDLYYRLNVFSVELPPLRQRKQDISYLLKYFLELFNMELSKKIKGFSKEALEKLKDYSWPGNVRELRNVVLRCVLSAEETIELKDLPNNVAEGNLRAEVVTIKTGTPLSEVEKAMIIQTLRAVKGNKLKAAEILGISRRSLYNKLEDYQIDDKNL
ncbi:MAG: sigma-54 dependent transcriptional regulator [Calditrichia bacterium]